MPRYLNLQCWVFRGDLATGPRAAERGQWEVRAGEIPAGVAGIGEGSRGGTAHGPRLVLWVSVTAHGNGSNNPHTSVNSSQASWKSQVTRK